MSCRNSLEILASKNSIRVQSPWTGVYGCRINLFFVFFFFFFFFFSPHISSFFSEVGIRLYNRYGMNGQVAGNVIAYNMRAFTINLIFSCLCFPRFSLLFFRLVKNGDTFDSCRFVLLSYATTTWYLDREKRGSSQRWLVIRKIPLSLHRRRNAKTWARNSSPRPTAPKKSARVLRPVARPPTGRSGSPRLRRNMVSRVQCISAGRTPIEKKCEDR